MEARRRALLTVDAEEQMARRHRLENGKDLTKRKDDNRGKQQEVRQPTLQ
ncbi:hypothetical protein Pint_11212 [Pistacia integerrima]|uniref:Uncharacterized protein n=1 Tax=Pistacia integerrima TaxID=434235 RepID=A0ACC0XJR3_9ROSI|nr:hypothetical protein Pint_11212 [Pistacia integerrima]